MKRLIALFLALVMALALAGCGGIEQIRHEPTVTSGVPASETPTVSPEPSAEPSVVPTPVDSPEPETPAPEESAEPTPDVPMTPEEILTSTSWVYETSGYVMYFYPDGTSNEDVCKDTSWKLEGDCITLDGINRDSNVFCSLVYQYHDDAEGAWLELLHSYTGSEDYIDTLYSSWGVDVIRLFPRNAPPTSAAKPANTGVTKTDHMEIIGLCVDDSYRDEDDSPLRLVYLFYRFSATNKNLEIDSVGTGLTVNETNTYTSKYYAATASAKNYMPNYYYSSYVKTVYLGTSLLVAATFMIPEGDLTEGRKITLTDSRIPDAGMIYFYTDELHFYDSPEEMAKTIDEDGYQEILVAYEEADWETTSEVRSMLNGRYWWCLVNDIKYEATFDWDNYFEVSTSLGVKNSGTYSVRNGYIFCTYSSNGQTVMIPYELKDGDIALDLVRAFDVWG